MESRSDLRRLRCSGQRASGNKRFHLNIFEQGQIGRGDAAGNRQLKADIRERFHPRQIGVTPLLSAGLSVAAAMVNRLTDAGAVPGAGVIQRPVTEQLDLNFAAAGLRDGVALLNGGERRGADDGHPVSAGGKGLLGQRFPRIGNLPVGDDEFIRALGAQSFHRAQAFG